MKLSSTPIDPVVKTRDLPLAPDQAFRLFTERMGDWWPLISHSISQDPDCTVTVEERVGGRIIETAPDGQQHSWAEIIAWDPPHRLAMAWHPNPQPEAASIIDVRFEATGGGSVMHLEHRGWEEFGLEAGSAARDQYDPGWDMVLQPFADAATAAMADRPGE